MDFWNHKVNVSKEAAKQQIAIINTFSSEKRMQIALDFANMGIQQTRNWIKEQNPYFSELEVTLEFVRLIYYRTGKMPAKEWDFFQSTMQLKIKKDWSSRFRRMMKDNNWTYGNIAQIGGFKNAEVVKSTISRGLPAFAKLAVILYEQHTSSHLLNHKK